MSWLQIEFRKVEFLVLRNSFLDVSPSHYKFRFPLRIFLEETYSRILRNNNAVGHSRKYLLAV